MRTTFLSLSVGLLCLAVVGEASEYGQPYGQQYGQQYETSQQSRIKLNLGLHVPPIVLKLPRMELPQLTIGANLIKRPNAKPLTINMPPMPQLSFGDSGGYEGGNAGYQHGSDYPKDQYSAGSQPNANYEKSEPHRPEGNYMGPQQDMRTYASAPMPHNSPNVHGPLESTPQPAPSLYPAPGPFPMPPHHHFLPPPPGPNAPRPHEMQAPMLMPHANLLPPFAGAPPMPSHIQPPRLTQGMVNPQPYGPPAKQHAPVQRPSFGPNPAPVNHNMPVSGFRGPNGVPQMENPMANLHHAPTEMHSEELNMNYPVPKPSMNEVAPGRNLPPQQSFRLMPIAVEHSSNNRPQAAEEQYRAQPNEYMYQNPAGPMFFEPNGMINEEDLSKAYNAAPHRVPLRRQQTAAVAPMPPSMHYPRIAA